MVTRGRFRYAPKLFVDYLKTEMPDVWPCTKIPKDRQAPPVNGRPIVHISTVPGPAHSSRQLSWRRLIFDCTADDEISCGDVCEDVRSAVVASRYDHICRDTTIVGEPARVDLGDEPVPRFQVTIDVLLRETYPRQAATVTA